MRLPLMIQMIRSSLRAYICPEGVDPLAVAAQDEGKYVVREVVGHRLEGKNKFEDETEEWLPYMEVRDLQAFEEYIRNHRDFAR